MAWVQNETDIVHLKKQFDWFSEICNRPFGNLSPSHRSFWNAMYSIIFDSARFLSALHFSRNRSALFSKPNHFKKRMKRLSY